MAEQIVIFNGDQILVDDSKIIPWADKGKNWQSTWCPDNYHVVIWNNQPGQNEIQTKDPATGNMTGNTNLTATSSAVGNTTVADLLTWAEVRLLQIEEAWTDWAAAVSSDATNGTTEAEGKTWKDYDPNYS
jgi:hypothetical protein|tara:strand:- start:3290 stop:3682 length:393 start_codon:yes stop_codon:yes gene_type:complete